MSFDNLRHLFGRRIIAEAERMARLNQQRKEEELAARMKRSTEGPAHHIVQVSCLSFSLLSWEQC